MRGFIFSILVLMVNGLNAQEKDSSGVKEITIDSEIFQELEVYPSVDKDLWREHLQANLQKLIEKAAKKGMKAGSYTINVRFLVEKDGSISEVKALDDPGYGLAKGSEKVIKTSPKWKPGMINGRPVRSYHTQPISFVITN